MTTGGTTSDNKWSIRLTFLFFSNKRGIRKHPSKNDTKGDTWGDQRPWGETSRGPIESRTGFAKQTRKKKYGEEEAWLLGQFFVCDISISL